MIDSVKYYLADDFSIVVRALSCGKQVGFRVFDLYDHGDVSDLVNGVILARPPYDSAVVTGDDIDMVCFPVQEIDPSDLRPEFRTLTDLYALIDYTFVTANRCSDWYDHFYVDPQPDGTYVYCGLAICD